MKPLSITFDPGLIDHHILIMTITGYCIVLISLALLGYVFSRMHRAQDYLAGKRMKNSRQKVQESTQRPVMTGEENAAIAAALFLFFSEMHDEEKYVMTIRKVSKTYSPWNSKIYGILNNLKHW
jgi:Na+-transporting methylmalonyl-CoA/oxaloacetate decarboxylase gamma subunit